MVYVYMAELENLPDPKEFPKSMERLPEERKEKILRCRNAKGRKERLGASLLLEEILQRFGHTMEEIRISETGKPEIDGIFFNLSHSYGLAVCAVSSEEVGCDIEKVGKYRESVMKKVCTDCERKYLEQFSEERKKNEFYRLWTMKESYVKMTGEGIRFPLRQIGFDLEKKDVPVYCGGEKADCFLKEYEVKEYKLTVCGRENEFAEPERVALSRFF